MEIKTFAEQIVKCRKTAGQMLLQVIIIAVAVCALIASVVLKIGIMIPTFIALIIIVAVIMLKNMDKEFEYSIFESKLNVSRITGKSSRKNIVSLDVKTIEAFEKVTDRSRLAFLKSKAETIYNACESKNPEECCCAVFYGGDKKGKSLLVFQPNEKIMNVLTIFIPTYGVKGK